MLRAMGWEHGQGLGSGGDGRTQPIRPEMPKRGVGLGGNRQRGPPTGVPGGGGGKGGLGLAFVVATGSDEHRATKREGQSGTDGVEDVTGGEGVGARGGHAGGCTTGPSRPRLTAERAVAVADFSTAASLRATYLPGVAGRDVTALVSVGSSLGGDEDGTAGDGGIVQGGVAGRTKSIGFFIDRGAR